MADLGLTRDALVSNHWSVDEANECSNEMVDHLSSEEKNKEISRMQEFDDQHSLRKRQKVDPQENLVLVEATEDSIIKWLGNFENGVSEID